MTEKRCSKCGLLKPIDQFWPLVKGQMKLRAECKACTTARTRQWQIAHPDAKRAIDRRFYTEHADKINQHRREDRQTSSARQRRWRLRMRDAVLDHYGRTCACCGSSENLTIDHIDGGGGQHRRELGVYGGGHLMNRWLVKAGFPPGFQTLCLSCNASKRNGSYCRIDH